VQCAAAVCALLACSTAASAQLPSPGYFFLEVLDEADKPMSGAATVVYDSSGKEVESSVTNPSGRAPLFRNRYGTERFVFRVIKPGYLTYEGTLVPSGEYKREETSVKLISSRKPKSIADALRRAAPKRADTCRAVVPFRPPTRSKRSTSSRTHLWSLTGASDLRGAASSLFQIRPVENPCLSKAGHAAHRAPAAILCRLTRPRASIPLIEFQETGFLVHLRRDVERAIR
jgi:hypothetical protein